MAMQTTTYKTRLLSKSGLSPQALLVALVVAELRYTRRLSWHEPLPITLTTLAEHCHMSKRMLIRYMNECLDSGWISGCSVFRDGRQKPNEYWITDPTDETECTRLHSVIRQNGQILSAGVAHISRRRLHTVVRSNNNGADDDAALRGGGGSDEQGQTETVAPVPAQPQAAGPDPTDNRAAGLAAEIVEAAAQATGPYAQSAVTEEVWLESMTSTRQPDWPADYANPLDVLGIRRVTDPVLKVACPAKYCRALPFRKCKHSTAHHPERVAAAAIPA